MKKRHAYGFSIIELLIVIAIIGVFSSLAYTRSVNKEVEGRIDVAKLRVELVRSALDSHIRNGCKSGVRVAPTIASLVGDNYLEDTSVATSPFDGADFIIQVNWPTYWQEIRIRLASPDQAQAYFGALGADRVDGTDLVWGRAYNNHIEADPEGAKQFRAMFEDECN